MIFAYTDDVCWLMDVHPIKFLYIDFGARQQVRSIEFIWHIANLDVHPN